MKSVEWMDGWGGKCRETRWKGTPTRKFPYFHPHWQTRWFSPSEKNVYSNFHSNWAVIETTERVFGWALKTRDIFFLISELFRICYNSAFNVEFSVDGRVDESDSAASQPFQTCQWAVTVSNGGWKNRWDRSHRAKRRVNFVFNLSINWNFLILFVRISSEFQQEYLRWRFSAEIEIMCGDKIWDGNFQISLVAVKISSSFLLTFISSRDPEHSETFNYSVIVAIDNAIRDLKGEWKIHASFSRREKMFNARVLSSE